MSEPRDSHAGDDDPAVVALRSRAAEVVGAELTRLSRRLPGLGDKAYGEITLTVRRIVDTLLYEPTARARELAATPGGARYATALHEMFDLKPNVYADADRADVPLPM